VIYFRNQINYEHNNRMLIRKHTHQVSKKLFR
jgi:hypothetical protein